MSIDTTFVLFTLDGQRYALQSEVVDEIVGLPELTVLPDAPRHLAGFFDLRGRILPVLDLSIWLGTSTARHSLTDSLILIKGNERPCAIIVNEVTHINAVCRPQSIMRDGASKIVSGAVRLESEIAFLLDGEQLVRFADSAESVSEPAVSVYERGRFFRNVPLEEQQVFHERALSLMLEDRLEDHTGYLSMAVVGLNGEYFGIPLGCVREFAETREITRLPCCPPHIVGNMNLRGEVLTAIDVRLALRMAVSDVPGPAKKRIIVLEHAGITAAMVIDEVYEVIQLDPMRVTGRPSAASSWKSEYWTGTATYQNHILTILDLPKLLESGDLVVNEEA